LPQAVLAVVFGCFAHSVYLATRSLWVPILLHFTANAIFPVLVQSEIVSSSFEPTDAQACFIVVAAVFAVITAVASGWGLYRLRDRRVLLGSVV
jgi:Type II CAAX prenyl endopeptidase Rce1-like